MCFEKVEIGEVLLRSWCLNRILKKMVKFYVESGIESENSEPVSKQRGPM